jgi:hypothetical protein
MLWQNNSSLAVEHVWMVNLLVMIFWKTSGVWLSFKNVCTFEHVIHLVANTLRS